MTGPMLFVFVVALLALVAWVKAWWSADGTALLMLMVLVAGGAVSARDAFNAFGNEALVTIAAMFVLSAALTRTGAVEFVGRAILRVGGRSEPRILVALMVACMLASAVINNTPIAVVFLPIVLGIAERTGIAASRFLLPMSYATIVGGMLTMVGTSTNLLVSLELRRFQEAPGSAGAWSRFAGLDLQPLPFLAPLPLAAAGAVLTLAYLATVGRRLLPHRGPVSAAARGDAPAYLTEVRVEPGSPLVGEAPGPALAARAPQVRLLQAIRGEALLAAHEPSLRLAAGDTLLVRGDADALRSLGRVGTLGVGRDEGLRTRRLAPAELLVRPTSGAIGATLGQLRLHALAGIAVLAVQRQGEHRREKIVDLELRLGDVLLVEADPETLRALEGSPDFLLLEGTAEKVVLREKAWLAVGVMALIVPLAALEVLPLGTLAVAACVVVVAGGCLGPREAYRAIDLPLLVLMAGSLSLGLALRNSGGAQWLAGGLVHLAQPLGDVAVLSAVYLATNLLTALVSNAAAALIMLPLGLETAVQAGMAPTPFVVAVMFAASIDFSTPIGYQTNTFVYGPGGYRFRDYLRVGGPLNLLWWLLATLMIPWLWPLRT
ncbi:MAG: SLC13 family permease [Planctomycetia bacterium]